MKFDTPACPTCGELAIGTLDTVPGIASMSVDSAGNAEYVGETEIDWDGQATTRDSEGRVRLTCESGHIWGTVMHELFDDESQDANPNDDTLFDELANLLFDGQRYIAHFEPQVWINDYAHPADPQGEQEWDCTRWLAEIYGTDGHTEDYVDALFNEIKDEDEAIDKEDQLKHDPHAPQWVLDWSGPFVITVRKKDSE